MYTKQTPSFNGISLQHVDVLKNIPSLIEVGCLLTLSTNDEHKEIGDHILWLARDYAIAANTYVQTATRRPFERTTTEPSTIAFRIQIARENLGMSEDDLAEKLDIHPGDVLTWEDGADQPLAGMIIPLANALKCDPMWLLTGESRHEPSTCAKSQSAPVEVMQNVDVSTIGKRIGVARVNQRMYTEELENAIHAPEGSVFRWETGKEIPSSQYIDNLARVLNVSVTWLLTGKITHQDLSGAGKQQHLPASQQADALSHEVPLR
ncbi:helix-turn-helix domain-containing protein [Salmonella enterica]|nr:helix-turn-helix domain-containing protein [Salmonella enterica]EJX4074705.1 helix-turn-helix domain-containing protein [Salmonella enterica]EJX4079648.1 helix-turn-helix domain-containing protein [Salmonella enterica]EJX4084948.1 helix-turn-helix domain-containing protein [Salmonella enterica]EJX4089302.1 helix-turn-helix domain-containing protein [Salmonella enterica]